MRILTILAILCSLSACAATPAGDQPGVSKTSAAPRVPADFAKRAAAAEQIIVGRLVTVDFSAPDRDGFLTTSLWLIEESWKGGLITNATINVRLASGLDRATGKWRSLPGEIMASADEVQRMRRHERVLLFLSRAVYEKQAAARGGTPLQGRTGAGLGLFRVADGRLVADGTRGVPETLAEARDFIEREASQ
jgi:hypothetical protein